MEKKEKIARGCAFCATHARKIKRAAFSPLFIVQKFHILSTMSFVISLPLTCFMPSLMMSAVR